MPKTYYDSELTAEQIEDALTAIADVVNPGNNGKVMFIEDGKIKAASASRWSGSAVLEPLSVTANGDYYPPSGTDGFDEVHVTVPSATLTTKNITSNGTYNAASDNADGYSSVTVAVPGGATVEPLEVTQNGTYNPPSGVNGYAPVTVNVSGGGSNITDIKSDLEEGTIDANGLNAPDSNHIRIRTANFYAVNPGETVKITCSPNRSWSDTDSPTIGIPMISVSFYASNDYSANRMSNTQWEPTGQLTAEIPQGCHYIRILLGLNSNAYSAKIYPSNINMLALEISN